MSPQPLQRPTRPNPPNPPNPPATKSTAKKQIKKKIITSKGGGNNNRPGGGNGGSGGGGNNRGGNSIPGSPWLKGNPNPDPSASFVEYLRWMRSPGGNYDPDTKRQIMQLAQSHANYSDRLRVLTKRTKLIAETGKGKWFEVECPWRIRVGGHRGPEDMLLPAFDATGMPYIPSSSLRGVARTQAIREKMQQNSLSWEDAEKAIASYFGSLEDTNTNNRLGKVTFLDAYPLFSETGGLSMDIATNIWKWESDKTKYETNPNPFFSLKACKFVIGLRLSSNCQDNTILDTVKKWLIAGLNQGIGSQVNTGYGELRQTNKSRDREFIRIPFTVEGQLIHGHQEFRDANRPYEPNRNGKLRSTAKAQAEVRPTAFKSMLRYWFRVFSLGVLSPDDVKKWEGKIFGTIDTTPPTLGWIKVNIEDRNPKESRSRNNNQQRGTFTVSYSVSVPKGMGNDPTDQEKAIASLLKVLVWLMLDLGGVGQGARRPFHERNSNPRIRGCDLCLDTDETIPDKDYFLEESDSAKDFKKLLRTRIREFYTALGKLVANPNLSEIIDSPLSLSSPTASQWHEAMDRNCRIIVCSGDSRNNKPYALATLHDREFKLEGRRGDEYDGNLCGQTGVPSPVWVIDMGEYQVVTVFGATVAPRQKFLELLQKNSQEYLQVFPF